MAQSAAAAAAFVGDLTILEGSRVFCEFCSVRVLYCGEIARAVGILRCLALSRPRGTFAQAKILPLHAVQRARVASDYGTGRCEAVDALPRLSGPWKL